MNKVGSVYRLIDQRTASVVRVAEDVNFIAFVVGLGGLGRRYVMTRVMVDDLGDEVDRHLIEMAIRDEKRARRLKEN